MSSQQNNQTCTKKNQILWHFTPCFCVCFYLYLLIVLVKSLSAILRYLTPSQKFTPTFMVLMYLFSREGLLFLKFVLIFSLTWLTSIIYHSCRPDATVISIRANNLIEYFLFLFPKINWFDQATESSSNTESKMNEL